MPISDEQFFLCPCCGTQNSLLVDFTGGQSQRFVTDCERCCRPITIQLELNEEEVLSLDAIPENE